MLLHYGFSLWDNEFDRTRVVLPLLDDDTSQNGEGDILTENLRQLRLSVLSRFGLSGRKVYHLFPVLPHDHYLFIYLFIYCLSVSRQVARLFGIGCAASKAEHEVRVFTESSDDSESRDNRVQDRKLARSQRFLRSFSVALGYLRCAVASELELQVLASKADEVSGVELRRRILRNPIGTLNEKNALELYMSIISSRLQEYPTTLEHDLEVGFKLLNCSTRL